MMILIGHPWIKSPEFCRVFSREDIEKSRPDQVLLLEPLVDSHALAQHCQSNKLSYAVVVNTLDEALYANALGAAYIICDEDTALMVQPVAQEYLFDTRVLVLIHSEKEISKIARGGIDGVIFAEAIC
jgi:NAD(P)H-dependent flavin oxidoreductase YrpB (nitropropane dioxygenase family)